MIRDVPIGRPYCAYHLRRCSYAKVVGYGVPEEASDEAHNHREFGEMIAKGTSRKDGKWDVSFGTCVAMQCHGNSHDGGTEDDAENCFSPFSFFVSLVDTLLEQIART